MNTPNTSLSLRQQDELSALVNQYIEKRAIPKTGWRIRWGGKFVSMRSGKSLWGSAGKASSAFKSNIRNDILFLLDYMKIKTGNPSYAYSDIITNLTKISMEVVLELLASGNVKFEQVNLDGV